MYYTPKESAQKAEHFGVFKVEYHRFLKFVFANESFGEDD
jgi:hypothetical protein